MRTLSNHRTRLGLICIALLGAWCVGLFGRGLWTPDEPREADISWRMSWQADRAVPLLAGEAFCEKPPLTYWLAGSAIRSFGNSAWAARLPNLLYALATALSVAWLACRLAGKLAAVVAAAACATFLLSYQVAIWLATDAPLLAAVALALAGACAGFHAESRRVRLAGYTLMHVALAFGFLAKSAAAWVVPVLSLATLILWERRFRELLRWELWIGLPLQALIIGAWVWSVYVEPQGAEHLRVFFWNNLVGRFAAIDAPPELQYTAGHQNSPGKYLQELPVYLFPWTLLVIAAIVRAWQTRRDRPRQDQLALRWALALTLPAFLVLSVAATARNIYVAPLLPGAALLLGWWAREAIARPAPADTLALRATALMLMLGALVMAGAVTLGRLDAGTSPGTPDLVTIIIATALGVGACLLLCVLAWRAVSRQRIQFALLALLLGYCALLTGPASQVYAYVDRWQDLAAVGHQVKADLAGSPLVLINADETTRAWIDLYVSATVARTPAPDGATTASQLATLLASAGNLRALIQLEGRNLSPWFKDVARTYGLSRSTAGAVMPSSLAAARLRVVKLYGLPNGRSYALLAAAP